MGAMVLSKRGRDRLGGSGRNEWRFGTQAPRGQIVSYDAMRDGFRPWLTDGMSFQGLASRLRSADAGMVRDLLKVNEEIEAKDAHVQAMASTRRLALTGMAWDIVAPEPDEMSADVVAAADEAVQYCRETLRDSESFALLLENLSLAIGPNLAVSEIIWGQWAPERFDSVPIDRLWVDYTTDRGVLIETATDAYVETTPGKFVTHIPTWNAGAPWRRTITSAVAMLHLIAQGAIKDWAVFAEVYGMPMRVAYHTPEEIAANRATIEQGLADLGTDAYAIIPEGTRIEFVETSARNSHPYGELRNSLKETITILYLGQTLTTSTGPTGSRAAAEIHDNVRRDLTENDARLEERTIRGQVLAPMLAYRFPGRDMPVPRFVRQWRDVEDTVAIGATLESSQRLGLRVLRSTAHTMLGIPEAPDDATDEKLIKAPAPAPVMPFGGGGFGGGV